MHEKNQFPEAHYSNIRQPYAWKRKSKCMLYVHFNACWGKDTYAEGERQEEEEGSLKKKKEGDVRRW